MAFRGPCLGPGDKGSASPAGGEWVALPLMMPPPCLRAPTPDSTIERSIPAPSITTRAGVPHPALHPHPSAGPC